MRNTLGTKMKQTITFQDFRDAFRNYNRKDNFSYEGLEALFEYLEQYEQDSGQELELDVIALCCDYNEDSIENTLKEYNLETLEDLQDATPVIWHDDENVLYQAF